MSQNYPDPFAEKTTIKLCLPYKTKVKLDVFDAEGRFVERLLDDEKEAGTYSIEVFAKTQVVGSVEGACDLAEGIYVYRLQAGDFSAAKTMLLLRQNASPCEPSSL